MSVTLHPKIVALVRGEVKRLNKIPKTRSQAALGSKPVSEGDVVNEILWTALRRGDVGKHYKNCK